MRSRRAGLDTFITEVSQDTGILFPWDTEQQFIAPLVTRGG
jgi:xanthine phosphoribosyltransferase